MDEYDVIVVGSYVQDHCWRVRDFPKTGESRIGTFTTGPGGKGFNQAVASQRQNARTCFLGALGKDALAETAKAYAQSVTLNARWEQWDTVPTATSSILVNAQGENRIVVALGANDYLSPEFVRNHTNLIQQTRVLVCQLENQLSATQEALHIARHSPHTTSILNPAPINDQFDRALCSLADITTPNETEFAFLMKHFFDLSLTPFYWNAPDAELHQLCRKLEVSTVVITLGDQGCFVSHADPTLRADTKPFYRIPCESVSCIDTTGAGDAFNGGLAAALTHYQNQAFEKAVCYANKVAALSTEKQGTAPAMPTRSEVELRFGTA
jgi:ribokinase